MPPKPDPLELIFDKVLAGSTIFTNRDVLHHDYVPDVLPHRDLQINQLGEILAPSLSGSKISNIFVYGKTGTGKTAVTRFVVERIEKKAREVDAKLTICYLNCRLAGTNYRVLADLCRAVGVQIPFTGLAAGEVLQRLRNALNLGKTRLIVVLDEIDALARGHDDSILYEITRMNQDLSNTWVNVIGVSNDVHFKEFLDPRVLSCLSEEEVIFKPYTASEIYDILAQRARIGFAPDILSEGCLRLCAAVAAREHGDARRALDLLRVAGEIAERRGERRVEEQHVVLAQQKIEYDRVSEMLKSLPAHSKLLLVASFLLSGRFPDGYVTGDVYNAYRELCSAAQLEPLTQRRISGLINELDSMGALNARVVSFGRYGRTKKISLAVTPAIIADVLGPDPLVGSFIQRSRSEPPRPPAPQLGEGQHLHVPGAHVE